MEYLLYQCWVTDVAINTSPSITETSLTHGAVIIHEHPHLMPSDYRWGWWTYLPHGLLKGFSWIYGTLGHWMLLTIADDHWARWVRLSWKPWLLKSPGYMRSISVFIFKESISSTGGCRKALKVCSLRAPNTGSNTERWNFILWKILLFYNQSYDSFLKLLTLYAQEWEHLPLDLRKACNNDKLCY